MQIVAGTRADDASGESFPLAVSATTWRGTSISIATRRGAVRVPLAQAKLLFAGGEIDSPLRVSARRRRAVPELEVPNGKDLWMLERPIPSGSRIHLMATLTLDPAASAASDDDATWVARPGLGPVVLTVVNDRGSAAIGSRRWAAALALVVLAGVSAAIWLLQAR